MAGHRVFKFWMVYLQSRGCSHGIKGGFISSVKCLSDYQPVFSLNFNLYIPHFDFSSSLSHSTSVGVSFEISEFQTMYICISFYIVDFCQKSKRYVNFFYYVISCNVCCNRLPSVLSAKHWGLGARSEKGKSVFGFHQPAAAHWKFREPLSGVWQENYLFLQANYLWRNSISVHGQKREKSWWLISWQPEIGLLLKIIWQKIGKISAWTFSVTKQI